jgi:hypothetical protein
VGLAVGVVGAVSVDVPVVLEVTGRGAERLAELEVQDEVPSSNTPNEAATAERRMARIVKDASICKAGSSRSGAAPPVRLQAWHAWS